MPILDRKGLNSKIIEAVQTCGWNIIFGSLLTNSPFDIRIYKDNESINLKIYIWNLTHGGRTRSEDEYRIQLKGKRLEQTANTKTLVLGWWDDVGVFSGFDIRKRGSTLAKSPSVQISKSALRKATLNGFATHIRGNDEIAVAFRPDFFVDYVQNLEDIHNLGESVADLQILENAIEKISDETIVINDADTAQISVPRRTVSRTLMQKIRQAGFDQRVFTAYGNQCAFCPIQLNLLDAAHIVPVREPDSTDFTSNGIALCALHHRAYDRTLITFNDKYETLINEDRLNYLRAIGHDGGMKKFIDELRPIIKVPPTINDRPNINYVNRANKLKGWHNVKFVIKQTT